MDEARALSESIMKTSSMADRDHLISMGTCFGKFTKTKKFVLHITALDYLAQYATVCVLLGLRPVHYAEAAKQYKVWVKPSGEMSFLYGNHVLKAHLGRITENTPK